MCLGTAFSKPSTYIFASRLPLFLLARSNDEVE